MRIARAILRAGAIVAGLWAAQASAQSYPTRPVTLVAPYSAGSGIDILARMFGESLGRHLGQPIVVDNRPGASGNIGTEFVAKSAPDGYTLLLTTNTLAVAPALYKVSFDPVRDFTHISEIVTGSMALVVNPEALPVKSLDDLAAVARAQPGKLNYASSGNGTPHHLDMEILKRRLGLDIVHIPYSGATGALNDLLAGHVQLAMFPVNVVLPFVKSGQLRVIAVSGKGRSLLAPDTPTFEELGLKALDLDIYYFLSGPAGLPRPAVERLNGATAQALNEPELRQRLVALGLNPEASTPVAIAALIERETAQWKDLIPQMKIKVD